MRSYFRFAMICFVFALLVGGLAAAPHARNGEAGAPDIVLADFEGTTYGDWKVTGGAFGAGPAQGALPNQMPVSGFAGHGLVNSFFHGDGSIGTLTSRSFTINRKFINFLIGGGRHPGETCISLLIDDKAAKSTTGTDSEHLDWASWDVGALRGKTARIEIVDRATGGWGHICVDQITLSDARKAPIIMNDVLYSETYRPQFHFSAKTNWLNDPNGLVYYNGEYHLFFQHNPTGIDWGNMTWGHAISSDLVHWTQLPDAIKPDNLGTIFSGSAVVDWNNSTGFGVGETPPVVAMYTAAGDTSPESKGVPFSQCLAFSNDRGRTFTKYEHNPVLPHTIGGNRDPKLVWFEPAKSWVLALYLDGDQYALFTSPDLKQWKQIQKFSMPGCSECPDFFPINIQDEQAQKWVFTAANGHYLVGDFDGAQFRFEGAPQTADYGANYYAVQTYSDIPTADRRRIQVAWMTGGKYPEMPFNQQMSFPCELMLRRLPEGLRLFREPVKEMRSLYRGKGSTKSFTLNPQEDPFTSGQLASREFDLSVEFEPGQATAVGFHLLGETITYDSHDHTIACLGRTAPLSPVNGKIKLRILVDRTSIELFGNDGRVSMTSCFLPSPDSREFGMFAEGAPVKVTSLVTHYLKSAWGAKR